MHLRKKIFLYMLPFFCLYSFVQQANGQVLNIKGAIFKKNSSERVPQALITDMNSQVVMMSDELGGFTIKAAAGDSLLITKYGYTPQKIAVANADDLLIYLQPVIQLGGVTIKGQTKRQELNEVITGYRNKGIYFDGKPPLKAFSPFGGSPITALYELFSKDVANERRFMQFSKGELESASVDRRYTRELVKSVTKLPDDEVTKFMAVFTPSYEDMKEWNDYQVIQYINKSFAYYKENKNKPETKLQKLY
jgi:hypothetical protein